MRKNILSFLATVLFVLAMTLSVAASETTTTVPDFKYSEGILTATTDFSIDCFEHKFQSYYNSNTGLYEVDIARCYTLFFDEPLDAYNDTIHYFRCNGIKFAFTVNSIETPFGYVDLNLFNDIPNDYKQLMNNFHTPLVVGFYKSNDNTLGMTNTQTNLITDSGVSPYFIYVRLNKTYSENRYNMANTIIHELGHAIIADIECHLVPTDWNSLSFIANNNLVVSDILNMIVNEEKYNYGAIYGEISTYASEQLCEIPSEAFAQVYLYEETATDFNKLFVKKMLEIWTSI